MSFSLKNIVPWGRSFDEYVAMFALSGQDLGKRILGCGDGPAAFNSRLTDRGGRVISVDPLYRYTADDVRRRVGETFAEVMEQTRRAHECIQEMEARYMEQGFPPYRVGINSMHQVVHENDTFWQTVSSLKQALDPNGIIAPGRYNLR